MKKKRCKFQGGAGLEKKFRPARPCLRNFEFDPKRPRQENCQVCQPFAHRAHQRAQKKAAYAAHPEIKARQRKYLPSTYRDADPKKYRAMQDAINTHQREWRKDNPAKSASRSARYRKKHPQKAKESQQQYHKRLHDLADRMKKLEAGGVVTVGDRVLRPKGGRPAEIGKAARVDQLRNQRMEWPEIQKQIAAEFNETTTINSLQRLLKRHLARPA